jgi:hypothetical protein
MTLLNILQTAKEVRAAILNIDEAEQEAASCAQVSYILENVMDAGCSLIDKKSALRISAIFKATNPNLFSSQDPIDKDVVNRYILEPEAKLKGMVGM